MALPPRGRPQWARRPLRLPAELPRGRVNSARRSSWCFSNLENLQPCCRCPRYRWRLFVVSSPALANRSFSLSLSPSLSRCPFPSSCLTKGSKARPWGDRRGPGAGKVWKSLIPQFRTPAFQWEEESKNSSSCSSPPSWDGFPFLNFDFFIQVLRRFSNFPGFRI